MATEPGLEPTVIRTSNSSNEMLLCAHCGSPSDSLDQQPFPSSRKPDAHWICRCGNPDCGAEIIGRTPEEAIARWNRRVTHETVEQRDGPSTCRQEGHDWKVTCSDCGEVRPIPYVHLNSGGHDRDAKIYSVRDVEALLAVGEAMSRHAPAQKASEPRPCPIPEADGFDIQGKEIGPGIWGVGKANWHPESGDWRGLADINGSLCVVTLKVTPSSEVER